MNDSCIKKRSGESNEMEKALPCGGGIMGTPIQSIGEFF